MKIALRTSWLNELFPNNRWSTFQLFAADISVWAILMGSIFAIQEISAEPKLGASQLTEIAISLGLILLVTFRFFAVICERVIRPTFRNASSYACSATFAFLVLVSASSLSGGYLVKYFSLSYSPLVDGIISLQTLAFTPIIIFGLYRTFSEQYA
jgi:uncharacterized membrane protein